MERPNRPLRKADIHVRVTADEKLQLERWAAQMKYPSLTEFLLGAAAAHRKEGR